MAANAIIVAMARGTACEIATRFGRMQIAIADGAGPTKRVKCPLAFAVAKCWQRPGANTGTFMAAHAVRRDTMTRAAIGTATPRFKRMHLQIISNVKFKRLGHAVVTISAIRFTMTSTASACWLSRCTRVIRRKPRTMPVAKGLARRQQHTVGQINL